MGVSFDRGGYIGVLARRVPQQVGSGSAVATVEY